MIDHHERDLPDPRLLRQAAAMCTCVAGLVFEEINLLAGGNGKPGIYLKGWSPTLHPIRITVPIVQMEDGEFGLKEVGDAIGRIIIEQSDRADDALRHGFGLPYLPMNSYALSHLHLDPSMAWLKMAQSAEERSGGRDAEQTERHGVADLMRHVALWTEKAHKHSMGPGPILRHEFAVVSERRLDDGSDVRIAAMEKLTDKQSFGLVHLEFCGKTNEVMLRFMSDAFPETALAAVAGRRVDSVLPLEGGLADIFGPRTVKSASHGSGDLTITIEPLHVRIRDLDGRGLAHAIATCRAAVVEGRLAFEKKGAARKEGDRT